MSDRFSWANNADSRIFRLSEPASKELKTLLAKVKKQKGIAKDRIDELLEAIDAAQEGVKPPWDDFDWPVLLNEDSEFSENAVEIESPDLMHSLFTNIGFASTLLIDAIVTNNSTSAQTLALIVKNSDPELVSPIRDFQTLHERVAMFTSDSGLLERLSQSSDSSVRYWVSRNPHTSEVVLDRLAADCSRLQMWGEYLLPPKEACIRFGVVDNSSTARKTLMRIALGETAPSVNSSEEEDVEFEDEECSVDETSLRVTAATRLISSTLANKNLSVEDGRHLADAVESIFVAGYNDEVSEDAIFDLIEDTELVDRDEILLQLLSPHRNYEFRDYVAALMAPRASKLSSAAQKLLSTLDSQPFSGSSDPWEAKKSGLLTLAMCQNLEQQVFEYLLSLKDGMLLVMLSLNPFTENSRLERIAEEVADEQNYSVYEDDLARIRAAIFFNPMCSVHLREVLSNNFEMTEGQRVPEQLLNPAAFLLWNRVWFTDTWRAGEYGTLLEKEVSRIASERAQASFGKMPGNSSVGSGLIAKLKFWKKNR